MRLARARARDCVDRPDLNKLMFEFAAYDHRSVDRFVVEACSEVRFRIAMRFAPKKVLQLGKMGEIERWRAVARRSG